MVSHASAILSSAADLGLLLLRPARS